MPKNGSKTCNFVTLHFRAKQCTGKMFVKFLGKKWNTLQLSILTAVKNENIRCDENKPNINFRAKHCARKMFVKFIGKQYITQQVSILTVNSC